MATLHETYGCLAFVSEVVARSFHVVAHVACARIRRKGLSSTSKLVDSLEVHTTVPALPLVS